MPKAAVPTAQISSSRGTSPTGLGGPGYNAYRPEHILLQAFRRLRRIMPTLGVELG